MATYETLVSQINTLEVQLAVLKAQLRRLSSPSPKAFGDLYGVFAGQVSTSEDDIDAGRYHFDWENEEID